MIHESSQKTENGFLPFSPVVRYLIIICSGIFLFEFFTQSEPLSKFGVLSHELIFQNYEVWRLFSFQFLHGDFSHLIGNMIGLYFFGPIMEQWLGSKRFAAYYLFCGAFGGLAYLFACHFNLVPFNELRGASGGLYGVMIGVAVLNPQLRVRLFLLPVELTMKQIAWMMLGFALLVTLFNGPNAGGEICHLGGAVLGYLLMRNPDILGVFDSSTALFSVARAKHEAQARRKQKAYDPKIKPRTRLEPVDGGELNRILDKISEHGLHSISDEERDILKRASEEAE